MLVVIPIFENYAKARLFSGFLMTAVFISAIYAISRKKILLIAAILLGVPFFISRWTAPFFKSHVLLVLGDLFGAAFLAFVIFQILSFIYGQKKVARDVIQGAALVYLLMAFFWAFVFMALERVYPGSFKFPEGYSIDPVFRFLYFSLVTISTLGYGDITPATSLAGFLSVIETIIGQLYLVIQVAWLVGMYISQSREMGDHL
jgi:voltage-gated potassium channel Kch